MATGNLYGELEKFLGKETPDFVQINYSITERGAEERMLPMLQDLGIAVIINRPFMNGEYFNRLGQRPVPEWAAEFDCERWVEGLPEGICLQKRQGHPLQQTLADIGLPGARKPADGYQDGMSYRLWQLSQALPKR